MKVIEITIEQFNSVYIAEKLIDGYKTLFKIDVLLNRITECYFFEYKFCYSANILTNEYCMFDKVDDMDLNLIDNIKILKQIVVNSIYDAEAIEINCLYICLNDYIRESIIEHCKKNELEYIDGRKRER